MKTFVVILFPVLVAVASFCTRAPRENNAVAMAVINVENQRIWLSPLVNSSRLEDLLGWPRDSLQKALLCRRFDALHERLLSEFRRCEKYGLYTMVDDSAEATMLVSVKLCGYNRSGDSLAVPVSVHLEIPSQNKTFDYSSNAMAGGAEITPGKNEFHYAADIAAELITSFPFRQIVYRFYSSPH
jgi:hypothetical protein